MRYFDRLFKTLNQRLVRRARSAPPQLTMAKTDPPPLTFEAALAELESILSTMEDGQLPLADTLSAYKRGAELLQFCQAALKDAQQQVQVLERGVLQAFATDEQDAGMERDRMGEPDAS
jgi:exodeoxyribonuclease VII small subunit